MLGTLIVVALKCVSITFILLFLLFLINCYIILKVEHIFFVCLFADRHKATLSNAQTTSFLNRAQRSSPSHAARHARTCASFLFLLLDAASDAVVLLIDRLIAAHLRQDSAGLLSLSFLNEPPRAFGQKEKAKKLYNSWNCCKSQHVPAIRNTQTLWNCSESAAYTFAVEPNSPQHTFTTGTNSTECSLIQQGM